MTQQDRRFASLEAQSRQWLSVDEYELLRARDSEFEPAFEPGWWGEADHDGWAPIRPRTQPTGPAR
jgi:hypothetical protein